MMSTQHCASPTYVPPYRQEPHDEAAETDELIRSEIAQLIDRIKIYGRTLPNIKHMGETVGRYDVLIDSIADAQHDWLDGLLPANGEEA